MMYAADFALSEGGAQARIFLLVRSRPLSLHAHPDPTAAPLLDLDPELGTHVPAEQLPAVRRALHVPVTTITRSHRQLASLVGAGGFVLLDGMVISRLAVAGSVGLELLGPGDVVTPATSELEGCPLPVEQSWTTTGTVRLALLPDALPSLMARLPGLAAAFAERQQRRAERARVLHAIATVTRVDVRILALLWHLAGRWGRVTREGVLLRLPLTHRVLAELIGARRPTVTTALGQLESRGALSRRPRDEWLLHGTPPAAHDDADDAGVIALP